MQLIRVLSDIHYACAAEQARGDFRGHGAKSHLLRIIEKIYSRFIWRKDPFAHNHLVSEFCALAGQPDWVVGNGDFTCNTAFVGISDDAALTSAHECLAELRHTFGDRLLLTVGDHEIGKFNFLGGQGGLRLSSWDRLGKLGLSPFWRVDLGHYVMMGVTSTLLAYPIFEPESLPEEKTRWIRLREDHLKHIRDAFCELKLKQRVLLFCHDPSGLPFLLEDEEIAQRINQIEMTVIGHLHSELILLKSRLLSGMPRITFMGSTVRRLSTALSKAKSWKPFKIRLCPALGGIELLKDRGYAEIVLPEHGAAVFRRMRL